MFEEFFVEHIAPMIFSWLSGLKDSDFKVVVNLVKEAEQKFTTGDQKKQWVISQIESMFNEVLPYVLNFVVEFAVAYAKKTGLLK